MDDRKLRILIIEDDPDDRLIVREMLEEEASRGIGVELIEASCLGRGAAILQEQPFDVILLDLGLPDSFGISSIDVLMDCRQDVPIVVMTGNEDEKTGIESVKCGAQDFIIKGQFDSRLLMRIIRYSMERQQHLRERMRLNGELRKRVRELEKFADYLSHNIKNNLLVIKRISDMAETCPDFVLKNSKTLADSSETMVRCVNKLLEHVRAGRETGRKSEIGIAHTVMKLFEKLRPSDLMADIRIADRFPTMEGDPLTIERLFHNLLENSIQYRDPGKARLSISLDYELSGENLILRYRDNGIGIEAERLEHIFESWHTSASDNHLGIGLAIVKKTVEVHGGSITAFSGGRGRGTEFTITMPGSRDAGEKGAEKDRLEYPALV